LPAPPPPANSQAGTHIADQSVAITGAPGPASRFIGVCCPSCSAPMKLRIARRGRHSGNKFYGCVRYPSCRGIRSVASVAQQLSSAQQGDLTADTGQTAAPP
jgi:ssDNA-binding Zn-finger/Zn-ribbon topoisomerase 1